MADSTTTTLLSASDRLLALTSDGRYIAYYETTGDVQTLNVLDLTTDQSTEIDTYTVTTTDIGERDPQSTTITNATFSADGHYLFYSEGYGQDLPGSPDRLLVKDLQSPTPPVDITPPMPPEFDPPIPNIRGLIALAISNDGNVVVYAENYTDFGGAGEGVDFNGIVVDNLATGVVGGLNTNAPGSFDENDYSDVQLSGDGRYLIYQYQGASYIRDLQSNTQQVITGIGVHNVITGTGGGVDGIAFVSSDQRYVAYNALFGSVAEVFLHDNDAPSYAQDQIISTSADGVVANGSTSQAAFSGNGEFDIFSSTATNLIPGVGDGNTFHTYIKDIKTGAIRLIDGVGGPLFISDDGSEIISQAAGGVAVTTVNKATLIVNAIEGRDYVNGSDDPVITVSGTSDAIGKTVFLSIPGGGLFSTASALVLADGTWTTTISTSRVGEGAADLHAVVTDDFGNATTVDHPFIVDRTPPADLAITSVAGDNIINAAEISHATISGTVLVADPTGAGTDAGSLRISIDGGGSKTFVTQPSGSLVDADFSQVFDASGVADGEHTITLTATDPAGNTSTVTKQVLVDTTPPKIAITSVSGDDVVDSTEAKSMQGVNGTSDAIGQTVDVLVDGVEAGQAVVQADGTWITTVSFADTITGEHDVTANVDDEAGNPGRADAGVYVDRGFTVQQLSDGPDGEQGGGSGVMFPSLSADGTRLVFTGVNFDLMASANGATGTQVYIKNLTTGAITLATPNSSGNSEFGAISQDGTRIAFVSNEALDPTGHQQTGLGSGYYTYEESLSDGVAHLRAFDSQVPDALNFQLPNGKQFAEPNQTFPLSIGNNGYDSEVVYTTTGSGSVVQVFENIAVDGSITSGGTATSPFNQLETLTPSPLPAIGTFQAYDAQFSADGSVAAIEVNLHAEQSSATPLSTNFEIYAGSTNPSSFGHIALASSDSSGHALPFGAVDPALSANGQFVAFWSWTSGGAPEVYRKNLTTGELDVVSSDASGVAGVNNASGTFTGGFNTIAISADGNLVAFTSDATLTPDDSGTGADLFVKNMTTEAIERLDLPPGTFADDLSTQLAMAQDGQYIAFTTSAGLSPLDNNNAPDIYGVSLASFGTPPQITIGAVAGDDRINAAEISHSLTVSGMSDAIGQTVTLVVDGNALPGVVVGSGGTWSTTIDTTYLIDGVHQLRATVATSGGATDTVGDLVTVDTVAPTVTLSADDTHLAFGQSATITASFSEGIGNVTAGFFSAIGGTLSDIEFTDNHTLTALFTPTSGATAYGVDANSGTAFDFAGNANLSGAFLELGVPISSGQTVVVSSGQTGSGHTVLSGGQLVVSSGGSDVNPVLSSGGSEVVSSGGTTIDTAVSSGGTLIVSSGGVGDPTTIHSGGSEVVSGGGTDLGAVISGGKLVDFGITSGVTVFAGGAQVVRSGGAASGTIVSSGGVFSDFGAASGTVVSGAGSDFVQSGGVETGAVLSNGGTEFIEAHGLGSALTLSSGAVLANFGSASGTLISNGGSDFIENGGTETGATLFSGGTEFVEAGGVAIGLTVSNGGLVTKFGSASGTIVDSGGLDFIQAGGSETGATLASGGVEYVEAGGRTTGLTALSGGTVANYGGSESGTIVRSGALDYVEAAGVETGAVLSGGIEYLQAGGTTNNLTVSSGGIVANYGGSESGTLVSNGGLDFVEAAGVETRGTLFSGGIEYIESGATTNNLAVSSGGIAANYGGSASGTITRNGGLDYVEANAVETGGTLSNGGIGYVFASGTMNALMASSGGIFANYGGSASGTIIGNGGTDFVETGGIETGATVSIGGFEYVEAGGETNNLTVSGGGNLIDYGSGSGTIVRNGGTEYVEPGAVETGGIVSSGGVEYVYTGGTVLGLTLSNGGSLALHGSASGTMVSSGGTDFVVVGGTETGATLANGGVAFIEAGGTTFGLTVSGGGIVDNQGGSASGAMISAGGQDYLEAGAVETGATLFTGGAEYIEAGGTASGVTISGGLVDLTSGGVISGTVTFVNSGQLTLADSQDFQGLVAGFSNSTTKLDLQDITYVSGVTTLSWTQLVSGSNGSGTLTVSEGGHAANITLIGQYATGNFIISGDGGAGGTLVTDPPLTPADSATVLVHHE